MCISKKKNNKIRHLLDISEVKHATGMKLAHLNSALSGLEEYRDLKNAVRAELKRRKNGA